MNGIKETIKAYLDKRAEEDELFAQSYAKENKSIDECIKYILGEAYKLGNSSFVSDEEVYGWAVHYYDEDDVVINKIPTSVNARTSVELTEEEKEKARREAIKNYERDCRMELARKEEEKAKKEQERLKAMKEKRKEEEKAAPTLFAFE